MANKIGTLSGVTAMNMAMGLKTRKTYEQHLEEAQAKRLEMEARAKEKPKQSHSGRKKNKRRGW